MIEENVLVRNLLLVVSNSLSPSGAFLNGVTSPLVLLKRREKWAAFPSPCPREHVCCFTDSSCHISREVRGRCNSVYSPACTKKCLGNMVQSSSPLWVSALPSGHTSPERKGEMWLSPPPPLICHAKILYRAYCKGWEGRCHKMKHIWGFPWLSGQCMCRSTGPRLQLPCSLSPHHWEGKQSWVQSIGGAARWFHRAQRDILCYPSFVSFLFLSVCTCLLSLFSSFTFKSFFHISPHPCLLPRWASQGGYLWHLWRHMVHLLLWGAPSIPPHAAPCVRACARGRPSAALPQAGTIWHSLVNKHGHGRIPDGWQFVFCTNGPLQRRFL